MPALMLTVPVLLSETRSEERGRPAALGNGAGIYQVGNAAAQWTGALNVKKLAPAPILEIRRHNDTCPPLQLTAPLLISLRPVRIF